MPRSATSMERRFLSCFENSIHVQKTDLSSLLRASASPGTTDAELRLVIEECMRHYEDYSEQRRTLAQEDGPTFFSPPWCAPFENSMLWIGGCRPSLVIRLLYSVTGSEMETHLEEFLQGQRGRLVSVGLMGLTAGQLENVNELHQRTLRAEDRLSSRLATIQEDVADKPILPIIRARQRASSSSAPSSSASNIVNDWEGMDREVEMAMQTYADGLAKLVSEADTLRMGTARTLLMEILSPRQAVELLVTAKQLHLSLHDWAMNRDHRRGRD